MRVLAAVAFVLFCFGLLVARLVWLQIVQYDSFAERAESNRIAVVPIVPNRGLIKDRKRRRAGEQLLGLHAGDQPREGHRPGRHHRGAGPGAGHPAARQAPLQAPGRRGQAHRLAAHPHQADGRGGGALHGPALPLSGRGDQGAPVPLLPAGRGRRPPDRLHRPHPTRPRRRPWTTGTRTTSPTTAAPSTSASSGWSRPTRRSCTASPASSRSRRAPVAAPVRRLDHKPPTPGNTLNLSIDIKLQALVEKLFGDRRGALVAIDLAQRRGAGLRLQAQLRPQLVRRRHRRRGLARPQ